MINIYTPHLFFVRLDGVLFAAANESRALANMRIQEIIATAYFHRIEDSDLLRDAHQLAEDMLIRVPPEQAERFRNLPDQPCYGTYKIEVPEMPEVKITFDE